MGVVDTGGVNLLGGVSQPPQNTGRIRRWQLFQNVLCDGEDCPVVDGKDVGPRGQHLTLRIGDAVAAH